MQFVQFVQFVQEVAWQVVAQKQKTKMEEDKKNENKDKSNGITRHGGLGYTANPYGAFLGRMTLAVACEQL